MWITVNNNLILSHIHTVMSYTVSTLCCRQCALVALQDVKAYLTQEGGQIAVSALCLSVHLSLCVGSSPKTLKYPEHKHIWH